MTLRSRVRHVVAGGICVCVLALRADAALIVNENSAWPTAATIETFPRTDANIEAERDVRFNRNLVQTFQTANAFQVDKFFIDYEEGVVGKEVTIRLFSVADVGAIDAAVAPDPASILFSLPFTTTASISTAEAGNNQGAVMEFDLTGVHEVLLPATTGTAGYAFQILRTGAGSETDVTEERAFKWHFNDGNNLYAGGRSDAVGGGPDGATDDLLLAVQAVPEPGAASLALVAAGAAAIRRRRRR